jgi:hypothetical protein
MADRVFTARNGLTANGAFSANSTQVSLGSNVFMTPTSIYLITATGNLVMNSSGLFIGNSTVNTTVNSTAAVIFGVNAASQYTWTNTHTFSNVVTHNANTIFNGTINSANAALLSQTLTDQATVSWDGSLGQIATVTLGGNRTMAAPTNLRVGSYILHVVQDGVGSRTITWNAVFKWPQATAPVLSTTASRRDIISFICDGTNLYGSFLPDVR